MGDTGLTLRIDGALPPSAEAVAAVNELCDRVEDGVGGPVVLEVSGTPLPGWTEGLVVGLVGKWERALRRLERLPAVTVAVAAGEVGGIALDALLAADHRIAGASARLVPQSADGGVWPGMGLYRLARRGESAVIRRALLFGTAVEASEALAAGLLDELTDDAAGAVARIAGLTAALPGNDLAVRRQLMLDALATGYEEALGAHLAACDRLLRRTADTRS
ncbi:(3,5-dihydroxycyclohex-3-enyl)acetyl-CoA dehydratase subunit B [Streptomyces sp. TLI_053]|uniref:enoyl-CoA-hydratase DpgB n=1 Tax=Streptomyces sp. TLI_053 TaxID=1855352 RepID=UPI00087D17FD|nr:enoyl-CoA-hydratase DpgB [Streptomyces sp. TLI_053]SDT44063.1 (3,5-dihydroxycyclohex-3-enyl)acetyl-CoA dehydratase subunit B [Streptomyces sp. TLI_053]